MPNSNGLCEGEDPGIRITAAQNPGLCAYDKWDQIVCFLGHVLYVHVSNISRRGSHPLPSASRDNVQSFPSVGSSSSRLITPIPQVYSV